MTATRKAARALLLNERNELLLMCIEGLDICEADGTKHHRLWCTIGGGIDEGEIIEQAVMREIYEETGITAEHVKLGPTVWHYNVDLIFKGVPTQVYETYTIAKTTVQDVVLHNPTEIEKLVVKELKWWSLAELRQTAEIVFPIGLAKHLPDIITGDYPVSPIDISDKK